MHVWKRRLAKYSRWLHIYTSMTSFVIVFFFAVTGWTLNHADRFSGRDRPARSTGAVDPTWTNTGSAAVKRIDVVEAVRRAGHVSGTVTDFRTDDDQVSITFKGPGYAADATVDRRTGTYEVVESRLGFIAIVNDLHKGRDAGATWKLVIDISAALLTFVSLTGLVLIYFIHKHRLSGVILLVAGGVLVSVLYAWAVP
jgi:uncharacterized protein